MASFRSSLLCLEKAFAVLRFRIDAGGNLNFPVRGFLTSIANCPPSSSVTGAGGVGRDGYTLAPAGFLACVWASSSGSTAVGAATAAVMVGFFSLKERQVPIICSSNASTTPANRAATVKMYAPI